jgi:hypothetical protein
LPHPVRKVGEQDAISTVGKCDSDDPPTLTVAGQFKSTRTIDVLEKLGIIAASEGINLVLIGNGWPILAGWKQEKGFVSEGEFQRALAKSTAVLIPYAHYWQSGVAFRALEVGVPVLGLEHEQLATMYGTGYVGIVPELSVEAVVAALRRVSTTPRDEWLQTFRKFRDWVVSEWMTAFRDDSTEGLSV